MKLYCVRASEEYDLLLSQYRPDVLRLVDNGSFQRDVLDMNRDAEASLAHAKVSDQTMGEGNTAEDDAIHNYLTACFKYELLINHIVSKTGDLARAKQIHDDMEKRARFKSYITDYRTNIIAGLSVAALLALFEWVI